MDGTLDHRKNNTREIDQSIHSPSGNRLVLISASLRHGSDHENVILTPFLHALLRDSSIRIYASTKPIIGGYNQEVIWWKQGEDNTTASYIRVFSLDVASMRSRRRSNILLLTRSIDAELNSAIKGSTQPQPFTHMPFISVQPARLTSRAEQDLTKKYSSGHIEVYPDGSLYVIEVWNVFDERIRAVMGAVENARKKIKIPR